MQLAPINIVASRDRAEQRVVRTLRRALGSRAEVNEVSIDELAAVGTTLRRTRYSLGGVTVFVISDATLTSASRRKALVDGNPFLESDGFQAHFIWLLKRPKETVARYADLAPLADAMPLPRARWEVIDDLIAFARAQQRQSLRERSRAVFRERARALLRALANWLLLRAANVFLLTRLISYCGILGAPILAGLLLTGAGRDWRSVLTLIALFTVGFVFGGIETLDRWPWKGGDVDDATAIESVATIRRQTLMTQGGMLLWLLVPAIASVWIDRVPPLWWIGALVAGVLDEIILTNQYRYTWPRHYAEKGISSKPLTNQSVLAIRYSIKGQHIPRPVRVAFADPDGTRVRIWLTAIQFGARSFARPWFRPRDYVFISYAFADNRHGRDVAALSDVLTSAGIEHFLDRRVIQSDADAWRPQVAAALGRATHVLLVVSPRLGDAKTVRREAEMIVTRWHIDSMPAVLCIGALQLGMALAVRRNVPLELRFMLAWCPWMSNEEALDSSRLASWITEHRRQGRLRDWWTLLGGVR